jgi:hypothetical protein
MLGLGVGFEVVAIRGARVINHLRNSIMTGAVAGSPGTLPTNWSVALTNGTGLTQTLATGTASGVPYLDVRYSGTPSAAGVANIRFETATQVAAILGQQWAISALIAIQAGSMTNAFTDLAMDENTAAGAFVAFGTQAFVPSAVARVSYTRTLNGNTTGAVRPMLRFGWTNAGPIDMTLRLSSPRLERIS